MGKSRRWDPDYDGYTMNKNHRKVNKNRRPFYEQDDDDKNYKKNINNNSYFEEEDY